MSICMEFEFVSRRYTATHFVVASTPENIDDETNSIT